MTPLIPRRLLGAVLLGIVWSAAASAQSYPTRPITFVVPFAPGGLSDVPARVLGAVMQEKIGASIVVENKTGASGVIGATHVWRAEPDGYTLLDQCARRRAEPALHPGALQRGDRFRADRQDHRRPAAGAHHRRQAAVQVARRPDRRRQGATRTRSASAPRARQLAGDRADPAQRARRHQDHRRALSRLRPGRRLGGDRRHPGHLHVLFQRQAAGGRRQGARARGLEPAADRDLARGPHHGRARLPGFRPPRLRRPGRARQDAGVDRRLPQQASQRRHQFRGVSPAHGGARHDHPDRQHAREIRRVHARADCAPG